MNEDNELNPDPMPPQKGLPRFRYRSLEAELADARVSVRRWWWEYLRLSKDYWLVCQTSRSRLRPETTDEGLANIYKKFGNVHDYTFDQWWLERGSRVFTLNSTSHPRSGKSALTLKISPALVETIY